MRVISGTARGTKLFSVPGKKVRPTSDFVKENLFNIIGTDVVSCAFLDCFAGMGGVGIEALSRGASSVTFIDFNQDSLYAVHKNLEKTHLTNSATLIKAQMPQALQKLAGKQFDIIFLDPPYFDGLVPNVLIEIVRHDILHKGGQIIIELHSKTDAPDQFGLEIFKEKTYGNTRLVFMERAVDLL